ncbi:MAG: hypothetical protein PVJ60_09700 [Phycisphaerales bacterium]|jgi:hypothetical protein
MFNFFEQPWTLVCGAILVLFGVLTFRSVLPEKRHWWQWLLPIFVIVSAFGLDMIVETDLEKINSIIRTCIKAVQEEDLNTIETIIADNYSDSYHDNKEHLLNHCRQKLTSALVEKNRKTSCLVELSPPKATATVFMVTTFNKDSYISQNYKPFIFSKIRLHFQKQHDSTWLINRAEILEIDKQPVNWSYVR